MKSPVLLFLLISAFACVPDGSSKHRYVGFAPVVRDEFAVSTPRRENIDSLVLNKAFELIYNDNRFLMARSLLVFRNDRLVAEAYPSDLDDIDRIGNIQSCTKGITSIAIGIAMEKGHVTDLDEKLFDVYPDLFDEDVTRRNITVRDVLTMRSGLDFDNDVHTLRLYQERDNSTRFVLSRPQINTPGVVMHYNDGDPQLVSKLIESKSGKSLDEYVDEYLFAPLNIENWRWERARDRTTFGAFGLFLRPRDLGKLGLLLLKEGVWNEKQLVNRGYLAEATKPQVTGNYNNSPFGYYFWALPSVNGYYASGHGGQFLLIVPDKNLVVVYTAFPYTSEILFDEKSQLIDLIVASCK